MSFVANYLGKQRGRIPVKRDLLVENGHQKSKHALLAFFSNIIVWSVLNSVNTVKESSASNLHASSCPP